MAVVMVVVVVVVAARSLLLLLPPSLDVVLDVGAGAWATPVHLTAAEELRRDLGEEPRRDEDQQEGEDADEWEQQDDAPCRQAYVDHHLGGDVVLLRSLQRQHNET